MRSSNVTAPIMAAVLLALMAGVPYVYYRDSYTYAKCDAHPNAYSYAHGDPFGYANSNIYSYPDTYRYTQSHAEAASNTASSPYAEVRRNSD